MPKERIGPDLQARYCVSMQVQIRKQPNGKHDHDHSTPPFYDGQQNYHDLKYAEVVLMEKCVADALCGMGFAALEDMDNPTRPTD